MEKKIPTWAKAAIVAEAVENDCDIQTDYFNAKTKERVLLGFSSHTRDLFSEMRKAAATYKETEHLGPGKDLYSIRVILTTDINSNGSCYHKDEYSHWHSELDERGNRSFSTRAEAEAFIESKGEPEPIYFGDTLATFAWHIRVESIEHREKWSMGHGYYLKAGWRYNSGWEVSKEWINGQHEEMIQQGKYRPGLFDTQEQKSNVAENIHDKIARLEKENARLRETNAG